MTCACMAAAHLQAATLMSRTSGLMDSRITTGARERERSKRLQQMIAFDRRQLSCPEPGCCVAF